MLSGNKTQISESMHTLENTTEAAMVGIWNGTGSQGQDRGGGDVGFTQST